MVERHTLVGEIADDYPLSPGAIVVAGVDAHSRPCGTGFAKGDARGNRLIGKGAVPVVLVEFVWLCVVGDEKIHPAVVVVIEQRATERLTCWIVQPRPLRDVFKGAVAFVVVKRCALTLVGLRGAVRFVFPVERAELIFLN